MTLEALLEALPPEDRPRARLALRALVCTFTPDEPLDALALDLRIADCDARLFAQLDALLHHPAVQSLESTWRSLALVTARIDTAENIRLEILHCPRRDLADDLREAPEIARSGLYQHVYARAIGTHGAAPYGLVCADFDLGPDLEDIHLLRQCAAVAAIAHAPFVANAGPRLFDLPDLTGLPRLRDLPAALAGPRLRAWQALRACDDARNVGLCLPRFLLRAPYDVHSDPSTPLAYRERAGPDPADFLWGRASYLFAILAAGSFARHRWCVHLLGAAAAGGAGLLAWDHASLPGLWHRHPFECRLTGRLERALADEGLIPFVYDRSAGRARLHAAPSVQRPPAASHPGEHLGAQLPYMFLVARLAHYLKCVQRERIGGWLDRGALQRELESWLRQYVSDQDDAQPEVRARRPLRRAAVAVEPVAGQGGWYRCHLQLQPHLSHNSTSFTLALFGKLDRPVGDAPPEATP